MVIYNVKTKHFTLVYNEVEKGWFAMHSGKAKGLKIRMLVKGEELPEDVYVSIGHVNLEDKKTFDDYIEVLFDASVFAELIKSIDPEKLQPITPD